MPDLPAWPGWSLSPAHPCIRDSVTLTVTGFYATPCDSFIGVEKLDSLHVRVRALVRDGYACLVAPIPYPIRVPLGLFPAGLQTLDLEHELVHLAPDGTQYSDVRDTLVDFQVTTDCPPVPGPLPYVSAIFTDPTLPCAQKPTTLVLEGVFRDGCGQIIDSSAPGSGAVELTLKVAAGPDTACALSLKPWRAEFPLGSMSPGNHSVAITLHVVDWDLDGPGFVRRTYYGTHEFFVTDQCQPTPLPYVNAIRIAPFPPHVVPDDRICPKDSILVAVSGEFPNSCFTFRRIELLPSPAAGPLPQPPTVRIIVDDRACLDIPCRFGPVPWDGAVRLPPLPASGYHLRVELAQVTCSDTYPPGQLYGTTVPFAVSDSCLPPWPCLVAAFAPPPGNLTGCNAMISPTNPAQLTFLVRPTVALAGLQGEFRLDSPAFKVAKLEAIGPAQGMLLNWSPTEGGASFNLFAEHGAPIPPLPWPDPTEVVQPNGWPVLRVTVEEIPGAPTPAFTRISPLQVLGSDIEGGAVNLCPMRYGPDDPPPGGSVLFPWPLGSALICVEHECDFNADGLEDVRDLVTMVHCVNGEGPCPPDAGIHFDCDGDATLSIADVLCCARHILRRPPCPDCPHDSSGVRPEPRVALSFGVPVETPSGVDLPVRVSGADRLGAAMLTFALPLDRYDVQGIDGAKQGAWLALHEVRDGRLILGLICTWSGDLAVNPNLDLTLHLALMPGQTPGGDVAALAGEFSGGDGVMLAVNLGTPTRGLPGPARLALSENRPNPFSAETRFTLQLVEAADVAVGIYDLRGRAVATLFRGRLPSGPQEFRWDGRSADGTAAPNGVYFYRIVTGGKTLARKLILMRGN
jgi:hypothetical protein